MGNALTPLGAALDLAGDVVRRIWPDKSEQEQRELAVVLATIQGQNATNAAEATNPSVFVSGWRPYAGWVCGTALALVYIPKALVMTGIWTYQAIVIVSAWNGIAPVPQIPAFPELGVTDLIGLLGALLGLGSMRSFERSRGVALSGIGPRT